MTSRAIVYRARWVLPIATPPIENGVVVVEDGRIRRVAPASTLSPSMAEQAVDLGDVMLMPGLVNVHTHLELTSLRGFLEGFAFSEWLRVLTDVRADLFALDDLVDASTVGIAEGLTQGVTTYGDATASGASFTAMQRAGVRGIAYLETFGPAPEQCAESLARLADGVAQLRSQETSLVAAGASPHAPYTVSRNLFEAVAAMCLDQRLPMSIHVAESRAESAFVVHGRGVFAERLEARGIDVVPLARTPVSFLHETGVLSARPLLVHAIQVDDEDVQLIAQSGASVAHCPVSNLKLAHGIAPLAAFLDAGVPVGLGSDSVASNNRMDVLTEARMAALLHATRRGEPDALSAHAALDLATRGGARALGMSGSIGTLEEGKDADLVAFPIPEPFLSQLHDPAVTLVHSLAGAVKARFVCVRGEVRVADGTLLLDADVAGIATSHRNRLANWRSAAVTRG